MSGLTRRTECCPDVRRRPCSKLRHHHRIRIPQVRTCVRDKPYRRARSRECWRWSSPTSCCTGLAFEKGKNIKLDFEYRFDYIACIITAFEALLVPFHATGYTLFSGVHGLGALGALGDIDWDERHLEVLKVLSPHFK